MTDINTHSNGFQAESQNDCFDILQNLSAENAEFFEKDTSESGQRLYLSFMAINDNINEIIAKVHRIKREAPRFDFDENTPGNGYRSFLSVVDSAVVYTIQMNKKVSKQRESKYFNKTQTAKDVESCSHLISSLDTCLKHLETLISWSSNGNLFPNEEHSAQELLTHYEDINQYCFYGRNIGFQFCESLKGVLQLISTSMAVFSEMYYDNTGFLSKAANSVAAITKYSWDPELRARRIVNISQNAEVDFCKAFWFLSEKKFFVGNSYPIGSSAAVSKLIHITPKPFTLDINGREIDVPIPSSHIGSKPVQVRLISYGVHEGMIGEGQKKNKVKPARGLIIHCHGGGFVAQSSLSHEYYLIQWAKELRVPILSIDYSLAPEAPFPRALEEVTFAYCWALKNHDLLGSTGERIIAAGDSAGANIILATTLKCIHLGIPTPMGLFIAYAPTLVNLVPSPSRLLCMMDPLLPFGFMMRCLKAYACPSASLVGQEAISDTESFEEITESDLMELQAHKSPTSEASDTLTFGSLTSNTGEDETLPTETSQKIASDFLDKYALDSDTETDGTKLPSLANNRSSDSSQNIDASLQARVTSFVANVKGRFYTWMQEKASSRKSELDQSQSSTAYRSGAEKYLDLDQPKNLLEEFQFIVPRDPYLSPFYASEEDLRQFPPVRTLTVHLDPCLDDCVMFSKRLKNLNKDIHLEILEGLPHGFLNFSRFSKEASEGCKRCIENLKDLLKLESLPEQ